MGEELATLLELKDYIITPDNVEAMMALRTTKFNSELGFYKVFLECDALQIVKELKKMRKIRLNMAISLRTLKVY
jgi:hypothetical protein